jgi:hypothetical protein
VSGIIIGELGSVLVMVKVPGRAPDPVGVKVMVTAQLEPAESKSAAHGFVMV